MSVNPNGEAEVLKIYFKPRPRLKKVIVDLDFSTVAIKGRQSQGNLFSRYGIHKIVLKERGTSTLGGQQIWYDEDVHRLNTDGRGVLLGEFQGMTNSLSARPRTSITRRISTLRSTFPTIRFTCRNIHPIRSMRWPISTARRITTI